jgi:nucleoside-diphosphate-sugar epimerase
MVKIAIIGACGYVGTMIYDYLKLQPFIDIDCYDILDSDIYPPHIVKSSTDFTVDDIIAYDIFLYVAGLSRKEDCEKSPYDIVYQKNVTEALHIPKHINNSQLFIYSSTGSLYSSNGKETLYSECDTLDPSDYEKYEKSMLSREEEIQKLNKNCIALRFGTVIGLSQNMRAELLHNGLFNSAIISGKINIWNPNSKRSVLWYEDLLNCVLILINNSHNLQGNNIFNLVSFNTTILETANTLLKYVKSEIHIIKDINSLGFYMTNDSFSNKFTYSFKGTNELIFQKYLEKKNTFLELVQNPIGKHRKCIICKSIRMISILDLGNQPLANNFLMNSIQTPLFPLHLYRCLNCFHTQLDYFVDRNILFKNYLYESGTSYTLRKYFSDFAELYTARLSKSETKNVLELACNDCYQLDEFKKRGWNTYGIDPAENLVVRGKENGHIVESKFWGKDLITITSNVIFDLIIAENVLAHVNNPIAFLQKCESIMTPSTLLIIQTSQANMYFNNEFDTIYHEHISFFTIRSMMRAVENVGCYLDNVYKTDIHGMSYVFEIKKGLIKKDLPLLIEETTKGLYTDLLYKEYNLNIQSLKVNVLSLLSTYDNNGYKIIAYGAAAKGVTFINYIFNSSPHKLAPEIIIDDSPIKFDRFCPGTKIQIKNIGYLSNYTNSKIVVIILAWNFAKEITNRFKLFCQNNNLNINGDTLSFFPSLLKSNF